MKQTNHTIIAAAAIAGILSGGFLSQAKATTNSQTGAPVVNAGVLASDKGETHDKNTCKGKDGCAAKDGKPIKK